MNRWFLTSTAFILCLSVNAFGQQAKLEGHIVDDRERHISAMRVVAPGGQAATTDANGHFTISFPASVQPGQSTRIEIASAKWVIYEPLLGNCVTQSSERNSEPLKVIIVHRGSPLALSPKRLSQVLAKWATETAKLQTEAGSLKRNLDEYAFLKQYAKHYGFTLDQFKAAAEHWAQINDSDDNEERALKEYWSRNYRRAAELAQESAQGAGEELERANIKTNEASFKVIRRYTLAGNANLAQSKFREALNAYNEIGHRFETGALSKEKFRAEQAETRLLIGLATVELGRKVEGEEGSRLLKSALAEFELNSTFYSRAESPYQWARAQSDLGIVLGELGERVGGAESIKYLNESIAAHRASLEEAPRDALPQEWAASKTNLGIALERVGERVTGPESVKYFSEAVAAHRAVLEVITRDALPLEWAASQTALGSALARLGGQVSGAEGLKYLTEAVGAFHAALEIRTREKFPNQWATSQNNLGVALSELSKRVNVAESVRYLNEAIAVHRAVLQLNTREQAPQDWATAQNNLGSVLGALGERVSGVDGVKYLREAVAAHRAALEVNTREYLPRDWARSQTNLGIVLGQLGERVSGAERVKCLNEAIVAHRAALEIYTRQEFPQQWAWTRAKMETAYLQLHNWPHAEVSAGVLTLDPNDRETYVVASQLQHEIVFEFEKAFILIQQWVEDHPEDISAEADFARSYFTTGRFAECRKLINMLLTKRDPPVIRRIPLRAIEIGSLLGDNEPSNVMVKLDLLIAEVNHQPAEFKISWSFDGIKHFIEQNEKLLPHRVWLLRLFDALENKDRASMMKALEDIRAKFRE